MATHESPRGRPVEDVVGNAGLISSRGTQVVNLGNAMADAAALLDRLVADGADMEGSAIDKLREAGEEVYRELGRAADLYVAVGPYIREYGTALGDVQGRMQSSVPAADQAWATLQLRREQAVEAENARVNQTNSTPSLDPGESDAAQQRADEDAADALAARNAAYDLWEAAGEAFDSDYDAWESAFETAVSGIRSATQDGVQDSFWDNLDGLVSFVLDVLAIAGMVLAVLALVVGGPIVAMLALAVGVLSLVLTIYQATRGDAGPVEVGLAILGVFPFGALGEFASGGIGSGMRAWTGLSRGGLSVADDAARWSLSLSSGLPDFVSNMRGLGGSGAGFLSLGGNSFEFMSDLVTGFDNDMWRVVGELGTMPQQAAYATDAAGTFVGSVANIFSYGENIIDVGAGSFLNLADLRW
ncbi:hypothetical protein [Microbacterium arborescens]|uniref:hypothetical protein n=1 Tax=Microbacterium arborescens TaxID=33883 RepID=UPI0025A00875|nr:hypothetical protein [Microbacterium arborescens]WJM15442.1 hypothetical protein QUC20_14360 [Microbacterium arborescens]